jgi:hypothetical protein
MSLHHLPTFSGCPLYCQLSALILNEVSYSLLYDRSNGVGTMIDVLVSTKSFRILTRDFLT